MKIKKLKSSILAGVLALSLLSGCVSLAEAVKVEKQLVEEKGLYADVKETAGGLHPAGKAIAGILATLVIAATGYGVVKKKGKK